LLAIITLAIGIGMNTAIYSLIQDLFSPRPAVFRTGRVVRVYGEWKERDLKQMPFSYRSSGIIATGKLFFVDRGGLGEWLHHDRNGEPVQLLAAT